MKLLVKNNFLYVGEKSFQCSVGLNGLSAVKYEGDRCTPLGEFKFKSVYYREDKIGKLDFLLPSHVILKNDGWCDDPKSIHYNKHISFPFEESAEHLYRNDDIYDVVYIIDYNTNPIIPGKGSAIFLHICDSNFRGTEGCVAIKKKDMMKLIKIINTETKIIISN